MNIDVLDHKIGDLFQTSTSIVFRIVAEKDGEKRDVGMVLTKEDYERKMCTHQYNPILDLIDLPLRMAYLFCCLNLSPQVSREEDYLFLWRKKGTNSWNEWFRVKRY